MERKRQLQILFLRPHSTGHEHTGRSLPTSASHQAKANFDRQIL
jgi:hypothetical protein